MSPRRFALLVPEARTNATGNYADVVGRTRRSIRSPSRMGSSRGRASAKMLSILCGVFRIMAIRPTSSPDIRGISYGASIQTRVGSSSVFRIFGVHIERGPALSGIHIGLGA